TMSRRLMEMGKKPAPSGSKRGGGSLRARDSVTMPTASTASIRITSALLCLISVSMRPPERRRMAPPLLMTVGCSLASQRRPHRLNGSVDSLDVLREFRPAIEHRNNTLIQIGLLKPGIGHCRFDGVRQLVNDLCRRPLRREPPDI